MRGRLCLIVFSFSGQGSEAFDSDQYVPSDRVYRRRATPISSQILTREAQTRYDHSEFTLESQTKQRQTFYPKMDKTQTNKISAGTLAIVSRL